MPRALLVIVATGVSLLPAVPARADAGQVWTLGLSGTAADVNVRASGDSIRLADTGVRRLADPRADGALVTAPHRLPTAATSVTPHVQAQVPTGGRVRVDVREQVEGRWSAWLPAGSPLPDAATVLQARVTLVAGPDDRSPVVTAVTLEPTVSARPRTVAPPGLVQARVFATREGLVGSTTANGHVIAARDQFVALPSDRGLATKNSGDYTARICAGNGRCAWAPVWDVGPWNTTDDYWNPKGTRESFTDLPQGRPEAQAAYEDGYHKGTDGFGRTVSNPAGIDLADGVFWDGLELTDNSWVQVAYLWTDTAATVTGTVAQDLNVRTGPGADATIAGLAARTAQVPIRCQAHGTTVSGKVKTTDLWDQIGVGYWVSDAYVDTSADSGSDTGAHPQAQAPVDDTPVAPLCSGS